MVEISNATKTEGSRVDDTTGDPLINEAKRRLQYCMEWEASARERMINDLKFRHGDSDNGYQWPNAIRRARDVDSRPCLTVNQIKQHNLMIVNGNKKNKSAARVKPTGNGATKEASDVFQGVIRRIEYKSNALDVYGTASEFQVDMGIGWWRIVTDWVGPDSMDQEIFIRPVPDPLSIYSDPDAKQKDKSDAKFAFVFDTVPRDDFEEIYPQYVDRIGEAPLGVGTSGDSWIPKDHYLTLEYFRMVPRADKLVSFMDPRTRKRRTIRHSQLHPDHAKAVLDDPQTRIRDVFDQVVEWKFIVGNTVVDEVEWPGKYIPLICAIGEETTIDGMLDRKGHTRGLKDAQRMYNYNASSQVEHVALQGKTPWTGAAAAIEEHESLWNAANTTNPSYLPFNHLDDNGEPIPAQALPRRTDPPSSSPAFQAGMDTAFTQLMMASGQWQNQMGMMGNERTGEAIRERQGQSDTAVFHFQDNFAIAIRFSCKQLIDLIPKVYDTARVVKILADDGTDQEVEINPGAREAYFQEVAHNGEIAKRVFNPAVGEYDVEADVGPAFGTRREETVRALTLILTQAPALTGLIGDLLLGAMDFKEAQEAAQRLKRMVPPQALGQGPTQTEQQLQSRVAALTQALAEALKHHGKDSIKLVGKDQMRDIDVYKAQTERWKVGLDHGQRDRELELEMHKVNLDAIVAQNSQDGDAGGQSTPGLEDASSGGPPVPGARKAPDGEWYLLDPTRQGKYLRVAPLAQDHTERGIVNNG